MVWNVSHPSNYIRFGDSVNLAQDPPRQTYQIRAGGGASRYLHLRHNDHGNAVFADGHVESANASRWAEGHSYMIEDDGTTYTFQMRDTELNPVSVDFEGRL